MFKMILSAIVALGLGSVAYAADNHGAAHGTAPAQTTTTTTTTEEAHKPADDAAAHAKKPMAKAKTKKTETKKTETTESH